MGFKFGTNITANVQVPLGRMRVALRLLLLLLVLKMTVGLGKTYSRALHHQRGVVSELYSMFFGYFDAVSIFVDSQNKHFFGVI